MSSRFRKIYHFLRALIAMMCYGYPAKNLKLVGVTGTDGKTTTVSMIYQILKEAGLKVAKISTIDAVIGRKKIKTGLHTTTPDVFMMQKLLRQMIKANIFTGVIEVSSHALDQYRILGCHFVTGVVTNITPEHLDYHKTFAEYRDAKIKLLDNSDIAAINKKDKSYKYILDRLGQHKEIITFSIDKKDTRSIEQLLAKKYPEPYNQANAKAAIVVARQFGIKDAVIERGLRKFTHVSGRLENIKNKKGLRLIIDFAHTPNALENILKSLKSTRGSKLICVFGCAGERDSKKRFQMGKIAAKFADLSIFTAEDPRHEDVNKIINEMVSGADSVSGKRGGQYLRMPDRGRAIYEAINVFAKKGDTVVICGKGHEKSLAYGDIEYLWSDQKAVAMALKGKVLKLKS